MSEYKTVEGHPIIRDGEYETDLNEKVKVIYLDPNDGSNCYVLYENKKGETEGWWMPTSDLMRPWKDKQASKLEVTNELILKAINAHYHGYCSTGTNYGAMEIALQAVFDHIAGGDKMVDKQYGLKRAEKEPTEEEKKQHEEFCDHLASHPGFTRVKKHIEHTQDIHSTEYVNKSEGNKDNISNSTPLKVIKDFVEMMKREMNSWPLCRIGFQKSSSQVYLETIINSNEYQALKALVEKKDIFDSFPPEVSLHDDYMEKRCSCEHIGGFFSIDSKGGCAKCGKQVVFCGVFPDLKKQSDDGIALTSIEHPHEKGLETVLDEEGYDLHEFNGVEEIELEEAEKPVVIAAPGYKVVYFQGGYRAVKDHIPDTEMVEDKETLSQYVTRRLGNPDNYPVSTILRIADDWIDEL